MFTKSVEKQKFYYQDSRVERRTHIFEYWEAVEQEHDEIQEFTAKLEKNKDDAWLKEYITQYYRVPATDGQTNVDYMIERCERLYTWEEMERSWRTK